MAIKAIVFDIGDVLQIGKRSRKSIDGHHLLGIHYFIAKKLKISLDQYFDSIDITYAKSIEGTIPEKKALKILANNLRISVKKLRILFVGAYKRNFKFNTFLFKQAIKLKKEGYKIAILSDQWYLSRDALFSTKLKKEFKPAIISCNVGVRKPNLKSYRLLLKKLNLPAKNCLFIDNQEWNLKPARKLGMKTILYKNNKQLFKQLSKKLK